MYMAWFSAIVAGSFLIALFARMMPTRRLNPFGEPIPNVIGFLIPAAAFGIFSGLRNNMGDTFFYIHSYVLLDPAEMEPVHFKLEGGIMYPLIQYYCRLHTPDPYLLLMITALIACVPVVYIIYKYSCPYELGIALYVLTSYYTFSMNGIRQYAAAGILILGTKYMLSDQKKDFFKYLIFVFLAWLFHTSALMMIVIYFVVRRRAWTPMTLVLLLGTVFAALVFNFILPAFLDVLEDTAYSIYVDNGWFTEGTETGSNFIRVFVLAVPLVMAFMERNYFRDQFGQKWDILVNISIINLTFYILSLYNWIFSRFAIYTSIYVIIMMTYVITHGVQPEKKRWVYPVAVILYIIYFYNVRYSIMAYESDFF